MKKICLSLIMCVTASVASADTGASGIGDAADGVVTYMPYVRALCYVIAAVIAPEEASSKLKYSSAVLLRYSILFVV